MNATILILAASILITAVLIDILPRRVRRGVYFGVTTGPDFVGTPAAREVERRYRLIVWTGSLLALGLAEFGVMTKSMPLVNFGVFLQIASMYGGWLLSRKRVQPYAITPDSTRVAYLGPEPRMPVWAFAGGLAVFLLMFGVIGTLWMQYDALPEQFPTHYGPSGEADAFRPKSPSKVFGGAITGLFALTLVYANIYGIAFGCRRGGSPDAQQMRAAQQLFMLRMMGSIGFVVGIMITFVSAAPLFSGQKLPGGPWIIGGLTALIVVLAIGGTMKWREMPKAQGDDTPDDRWLGGLIYYNPEDPAMVVERRDNIGYTVNFAQPVGWVIAGSLLALLASVIWMATSAA